MEPSRGRKSLWIKKIHFPISSGLTNLRSTLQCLTRTNVLSLRTIIKRNQLRLNMGLHFPKLVQNEVPMVWRDALKFKGWERTQNTIPLSTPTRFHLLMYSRRRASTLLGSHVCAEFTGSFHFTGAGVSGKSGTRLGRRTREREREREREDKSGSNERMCSRRGSLSRASAGERETTRSYQIGRASGRERG